MLSPFELNFNALLQLAASKGASDLHIEPFDKEIRVRARIDGVLTILQKITEQKYFERFLMQAKRLCCFDMAKPDFGGYADATIITIQLYQALSRVLLRSRRYTGTVYKIYLLGLPNHL